MRRVTCPECRRFNLRPDAALAMLCDGCGAFTSVDFERFRLPTTSEPWAENPAQLELAQARKLAQARMTELAGEIRDSVAASRAHQKALWQEYSGLTFLLTPRVVPRAYLELPITRWIQASIAMSEIALGATPLTAEQHALHHTAQKLYQPGADPVAVAAELLSVAEAFYRALHGHLRFRDAHKHPSPGRLARDFVYLTVHHAPGSLGRAALARIYAEVLEPAGEPPGDPGDPGAGGGAGPGSDPWLDQQLQLWRGMARRYSTGPERAGAALQIGLQSFTVHRQVPDPADVLAFLRAAIPDVQAHDLVQNVGFARYWAQDHGEFQAMLDELEHALASWQPGEPPEPAPEPAPEPDEAWIRTTLAHWKLLEASYPAGHGAMALVSLMLSPFHAGSSVRPVAVRALLERLATPPPGPELNAALRHHRELFGGQPAIADFLDAVLDDLDDLDG